MGLGLAGAISGAGNAMTQGLQTLNSGIVQMGVNQSLAKNDREFQLKKMEMQQQFEREMQTEKIAADRENTKDRITLEGVEHRKNTRVQQQGQEDLANLNNDAAKERQNAELAQKQTLEIMKMGQVKEANDKDRAVLEQRYTKLFSLEERKINLEKGKLQSFITDTGKIALMKPDGKSAGYFADEHGEPYVVQKDMPQSAVLDANKIANQMEAEATAFAKSPLAWSDEAKKEHAKKIAKLQQQYDAVVGPYRKNKPVPNATNSNPVVSDFGKYKNFRVAPSSEDLTKQPSQPPIDWTNPSSPGLIERFYKKSQ